MSSNANGSNFYSSADALNEDTPMDQETTVEKSLFRQFKTKGKNAMSKMAKSRVVGAFVGGVKSLRMRKTKPPKTTECRDLNDTTQRQRNVQPNIAGTRLSVSLDYLCDVGDHDMSCESLDDYGYYDESFDDRDPSRHYLTARRRPAGGRRVKYNMYASQILLDEPQSSNPPFLTLRKRDSTGLTKLDKPLDDWGETKMSDFGDSNRRVKCGRTVI